MARVKKSLMNNSERRILKAAIKEFARFGYKGGRIDRIARHARVNKGMIYYYFGSKEKLYYKALATVYKELISSLSEYVASKNFDDPVDYMKGLLRKYFEHADSHPEFIALVGWENLQRGLESDPKDIGKITHPLIEYIINLIKEYKLLPENLETQHFLAVGLGLVFFYFSNRYTLSIILGSDLYSLEGKQKYLEAITEFLTLPLKSGQYKEAAV